MADTPKVPVAVLEYEPSSFEDSLLKHKTKLILVGVIAIVSTAGYWGYRLIKEASFRSAAVDFVRADSVQDLKSVAEKHSGKPAGGNALVFAAEKLSADRPGEAVDLLKDFLNKYPEHPLRPLASFRIGEYSALSGDTASAEKEYEAVSKANTAFSALAQLRLGDLKWAAGDTAKAQEYYDTIQKSASAAAGSVRPIAKDRVENEIKLKPPVLVDYVPEPPATPPHAAPGNPGGIDGINLNGPGDPGDANGALLPPPTPRFDPTKLPPPSPPTPPSDSIPPVKLTPGKPAAPATPPKTAVPESAPPVPVKPAAAPAEPPKGSPPPTAPATGDTSKPAPAPAPAPGDKKVP